MKKEAKGKYVKIDVIINEDTLLGKTIRDLHSLASSDENKNSSAATPTVVPDEPVTIQDCFNLFQKAE